MQQAARLRYPITALSWHGLFTLGCRHGDTVMADMWQSCTIEILISHHQRLKDRSSTLTCCEQMELTLDSRRLQCSAMFLRAPKNKCCYQRLDYQGHGLDFQGQGLDAEAKAKATVFKPKATVCE